MGLCGVTKSSVRVRSDSVLRRKERGCERGRGRVESGKEESDDEREGDVKGKKEILEKEREREGGGGGGGRDKEGEEESVSAFFHNGFYNFLSFWACCTFVFCFLYF